MSKDGYVPLSLIASFNRVQTLCDDINFIAEVCSFLKRKKTKFLQTNSSIYIFIYLGSKR